MDLKPNLNKLHAESHITKTLKAQLVVGIILVLLNYDKILTKARSKQYKKRSMQLIRELVLKSCQVCILTISSSSKKSKLMINPEKGNLT
jgi:hypothetical protein